MSVLVFGGVFGVAALLWVVWPLVRRKVTHAPVVADGDRDDLAERTLLLYQELEEIDLEHEHGDLTEDEYAALREAQKQRVLALLEARQSERGALGDAAVVSDTNALSDACAKSEVSAKNEVSAKSDASAISDAIEQEVLRIRGRFRGEPETPADLSPSAETSAPAMARRMHWLWVGVPVVLVLLAFGAIYQLYSSSARTLTEQTPIAQIDATALVGIAYVAPGEILMASVGGIQESRDGGRSWTQSTLDAVPAAIAVSPAGDGYAYVFTADSVHVTADAGRSWQTLPDSLPDAAILAAAVNPFVPTQVYASFAGTGLYRSQDGGRSWGPVATPDDESIVAILVSGSAPLLFIATESGRVQVSSDEGATWRAASGAVTMALRGPVRALSGAADGSVLYAASHTGLYLSTAAGQTWVDLPLRKPLAAVTVDPASARTVLAVTETGEVYRSTDGGIAWRDE